MAQYSAVNGQALQISALRNLQEILDIQYQMYDGFGNILLEHMQNGAATPDMGDKGGSHNYSEYFVYDDLHRLTHSSFNSFNGTGLDYTYDSGGNLLSKSDYARNYDYTTGTSGGPNAVKRVEKILKQQDGTTQYQWANFSYDARGNMTSGDGLSQAIYNAMDKPTYIEKGGATLSFAYGPSHMRYRQIKVKENITTTTHYVGKLFEKEYREENGVTRESWRAYIGSTAVVSQDDSDGFTIRYQHKDRLGSARTFTDANGLVVAQRDYDPFGKPREADGSLKENVWLGGGEQQRPILGDEADAKTRRGFTDHEHLDDVEYIHMNGRVYDYNLGRFLSVDPYVQEPGNSQGINPYSYILNNPLAGTDPTGYAAVKEEPPSCGLGNCYTIDFTGRESKQNYTNVSVTKADGSTVNTKMYTKDALAIQSGVDANGAVKANFDSKGRLSGLSGVSSSDLGSQTSLTQGQQEFSYEFNYSILSDKESGVGFNTFTESGQGEFEKATIREPSQEGMTAEEYLAAVENGLWNNAPILDGLSSNAAVRNATKKVNSASSSSSGDVISDPRYIAFLKAISKATANAGIPIEGEKFLAMALNSDGQVVVTNIGILPGQGGKITSLLQGAGAIAHVHPSYIRPQRPQMGDHSSVKFRGVSSFVIGHRGSELWEVGRIDGKYKYRTVHKDEPGSWKKY
ncbi:RHS repeat-associated core domain-containing protein [Teredinibacter sp. KSP-S5-2]|uniref:RHS repeat domain-containing protein n=1 Tax=Teredinibacter sp. KSP-S5-2 TaxID=3034506 RepID=UPI0029349B82|nr:RHS repeat-associated core domain-containing protein [Teredinibacter sp. KSP-S5-2]WNO10296.1 RHS repeat-associated core domain-containing protein [Teredinibacter sp. KSP-S5-2]